MPHLGRPYPWVRNYDVWIFSRGTFDALSAQYKQTAHVDKNGVTIACTNAGSLASDIWEVDYNAGYAYWRWHWPCSPTWECELRLVIKNRLEDSPWQWVLISNGVEVNRTREITRANPYGLPNIAGNPDWLLNPTVNGKVVWNVNPAPVPWPP